MGSRGQKVQKNTQFLIEIVWKLGNYESDSSQLLTELLTEKLFSPIKPFPQIHLFCGIGRKCPIKECTLEGTDFMTPAFLDLRMRMRMRMRIFIPLHLHKVKHPCLYLLIVE